FSSRRRHTRCYRDWSSDVCSSDLVGGKTVLVLYGQGLGGIALVERRADASGSPGNQLSSLPAVSLDGLTAHELATQLGTVLEWRSEERRVGKDGRTQGRAASQDNR